MSVKTRLRITFCFLACSAVLVAGTVCSEELFTSENINGNTMVKDSKAWLEWQQDTADTNKDGTITRAAWPDGDMMTWQQARDYCQKLEFGGYKDWRLPELDELMTIIDYGCSYPSVDPVFKCEGNYYWSATPSEEDPNDAMYIHFNFGTDHWMPKSKPAFVRCVRRIK